MYTIQLVSNYQFSEFMKVYCAGNSIDMYFVMSSPKYNLLPQLYSMVHIDYCG